MHGMNKAELYAKTLHDYFANHDEKESDAFLEKFNQFLYSKNETSLLKDVIKHVSKLDEIATSGSKTTLVVRDEVDAKKYEEIARSAHSETFDFGSLETIIDENIVGGYQVLSETKMIDNSYKKKLVEMYNTLIA